MGRPPQPITLQPAGIAGVRQALKSTWTTYLHMGSYCLRARDDIWLRHVFFLSSRLLLFRNWQLTIPLGAFPKERALRVCYSIGWTLFLTIFWQEATCLGIHQYHHQGSLQSALPHILNQGFQQGQWTGLGMPASNWGPSKSIAEPQRQNLEFLEERAKRYGRLIHFSLAGRIWE